MVVTLLYYCLEAKLTAGNNVEHTKVFAGIANSVMTGRTPFSAVVCAQLTVWLHGAAEFLIILMGIQGQV